MITNGYYSLLEDQKKRIRKEIEELKYKKATPMSAHDYAWDMAIDRVLSLECLKMDETKNDQIPQQKD